MKYRAVVEIEFETDTDPIDALHHALSRLEFLEHYHILELPKPEDSP